MYFGTNENNNAKIVIVRVGNKCRNMTEKEIEEFTRKWNEVTGRTMASAVKQKEANETYMNGYHIVREGEKPSMLKASSGITYLGNGKAVKYV